MTLIEFIKTLTERKPTTITCSCQRSKAWHHYVEYLKAHACEVPCTDVKCSALRADYENSMDHAALYFSLLPFDDAPWSDAIVHYAVFGESKTKRRLWMRCAICAENLDINIQKAVYYANGYDAIIKKHPKGEIYTIYLPTTF